jgi:hypothetical protein
MAVSILEELQRRNVSLWTATCAPENVAAQELLRLAGGQARRVSYVGEVTGEVIELLRSRQAGIPGPEPT